MASETYTYTIPSPIRGEGEYTLTLTTSVATPVVGLWDMYTYVYGLIKPDGTKLFGREPFTVGSANNHGCEPSVRVVLTALCGATMKEGDTDSDWFDAYTPEEREWSASWHCEELACLTYDLEEVYDSQPWRSFGALVRIIKEDWTD